MNRTRTRLLLALLVFGALVIPAMAIPAQAQDSSSTAPADSILNWHPINEQLYTAGQPGLEHMEALKALGINTIVSLATPSDANMQEANRAAELGMSFVSIPFGDDGPTPDDVEWFSSVMKAQDGKTVLVHCNSNRRASSFTFLYRVLIEGVDPAEAIKDVEAIYDPSQSETWSNLFDQMLANATDAAVVVQPGAPGQQATFIDNADNLSLGIGTHTEADVAFMQGMIHHHAQALEMVELMDGRTNARDLIMLGKRIDVSQQSEIKLMANWLKDVGADVPMMADPDYAKGEHASHAMHGAGGDMMPGMLTPAQMQELRDAEGTEFYRLWLLFMIQHHEGALTMVEHLFSQPGAAQNQDIFHFASEVDIDQRIEILRMRQMLQNVTTN